MPAAPRAEAAVVLSRSAEGLPQRSLFAGSFRDRGNNCEPGAEWAIGRAMKLYYTNTSPYARKVLVAADELGVPLEKVFLRPSPLKPDPELSRSNPLSKIPALVLD